MTHRAAVTGWAWRTPLGADVDQVASRLLAGERAARPCYSISSAGLRLGAPLLDNPAPQPHRRFVLRLGLLAIQAAQDAAQRAGCAGSDRVGLFAGVGGLQVGWAETLPAFEKQSLDGADAWALGLSRLHPFWLLQHLSNNAHALASAALCAKGEGATFGGANAGVQALVAAIRALAEGAVDSAVVMAYDSLLTPEALVDLESRGALTRAGLESVRTAYDSECSGAIPGEAAAAVVLEAPAQAQGRCLCFLEAAETADGNDAEPSASTLASAASRLSAGADVVDGFGAAQPAADAEERRALGALWPDARLTCTSAAFGRTGAAASLLSAIALTTCLARGMLPPINGLSRPAQGALRPVMRAETTRARRAVAVCGGAPGLAGAIRLELP
jgi:3-oxoacyl-(acyl-carrier-protein) synthase